MPPANQPASLPGVNADLSDLWSSGHTLLDDAVGTVLAHGGFTGPGENSAVGNVRAFLFDPPTLTWSQTNNTADSRFYATTLTLNDGRALTLFGSASKSIEIYTQGAGWAPRIVLPASMNHHEYYPWTYLLPDGRLFICGPHVPTQRFDFNAPAGVQSFPTNKGDRSTSGEKGTSVLLMLRPPDYKAVGYIMGGNFPGTENSAEQAVLSDPAPVWTNLPNLNQLLFRSSSRQRCCLTGAFRGGRTQRWSRRWAVRDFQSAQSRRRLGAGPHEVPAPTIRRSCCF